MRKDLWFIFFFTVNILLCGQASWTRKADFPGEGYHRYDEVGFTIGNKLYVGTGGKEDYGATNYNDFWEWDPFTDTWTQKADFGGGHRTLAVGFSIGHKGYIATGYSANSYTYTGNLYNDLWEYDPVNNSWTQKASMPCSPTTNACAFVIGNKGYIVTEMGELWEWEQLTNTWSQKASFPLGFRHLATSFSIGPKGYLVTGSDQNAPQKDLWEWNQSTDTWQQKADFPYKAGNTIGFTIASKAYVGFIPATDTARANKIWEWDPDTDVWTLAGIFPGVPRPAFVGISNGNKAYISIPGYEVDEFWEFAPFGTSAIQTSTTEANLKVFPNPTVGSLTLSLTSKSALPLQLSLKNSLGQIVYIEKIGGFSGEYTNTISPQDHAKGVYLLELVSERDCFTQRVIVE